MSTYNYTIDFNDSEIITLQAALELLVEKCDEELKEGAKAPYLAHKDSAIKILEKMYFDVTPMSWNNFS